MRDAAATATNDNTTESSETDTVPSPKVQVDMTSRFIGLVVVPGQHITKIELEETPQQMRVREALRKP